MAAAVIPLGIPQLTHIGAGVNNDALLLLLMGILTLMALRFATGHVDGGGIVLAGVLTGLVGRHRKVRGAVAVALLAPTLLLGGFVFLSGLRLYQLSGARRFAGIGSRQDVG